MRPGFLLGLILTACVSRQAPVPALAPIQAVAQGAALAFHDFVDSTEAAPRRPDDPKPVAYLSPFMDPAGTAMHDPTWLAAAVRSGRVRAICSSHRTPLCPVDARGSVAYVFEVLIGRATRDTLQLNVLRTNWTGDPKGLAEGLDQSYTLVNEGGHWRIGVRGLRARVD